MTAQLMKPSRAIADLSAGVILAVVEIAAPPSRVFRALTTDEVAAWWGSADTYRVTAWSADVRVGGTFRSGGLGNDGTAFEVRGEYLEVDPPKRLVHTWSPDWEGGARTVVRYQLDEIPGGTRVTLRHEGFGDRAEACASHGEGWERVLSWLSGHFTEAAAPRAYYFCRLVPPRTTFATDMDAEERAIMAAHGAYWRELLAQGTAIVFGPVADPAGVWGVAVAAADDEPALRAILGRDPAMQSGRGFRFESLPMLAAVHA